MITLADLYNILVAVTPLCITMFLAYISVRRWKLFTLEQFLAADVVSKIMNLAVALAWARFARRGSLDWAITAFSLSSLPNTLIVGIPLLKSMYGDDQEGLIVQVVVLQCIAWYTLLLFLFEYREARGIAMREAESRDSGGAPAAEDVIPAQDPEEAGDIVGVVMARPSPSVPEPDQQPRGQVLISDVVSDHSGHEPVMAEEGAGRQLGGSTTSLSKMVMTILRRVWWKLVKNPNIYASLLGVSLAFASYRWDIKKPRIIENSVAIIANAGLGMAMFSLGLFMAMQPRVVACGYRLAAQGITLRFFASPLVMGVASLAFGLRGKILKVSIVQAAVPQGIVPFLFAREYNLHPDVLSTAVIFGMIVSLPITVLYYVLLSFFRV